MNESGLAETEIILFCLLSNLYRVVQEESKITPIYIMCLINFIFDTILRIFLISENLFLYFCRNIFMYTHKTKLRVRYGETDQMKYAYYGVYAQYFEVGRVELLRSLGITYKELEDLGFALPVVNYNINYKKPAFYDDELTIETTIKEPPSIKIIFNYRTLNEKGEVLNTAETTLVFVNKETGIPCLSPEILTTKFNKI